MGFFCLSVSGTLLLFRSQAALESLKNTNAFNKIGISLRTEGKPSPDSLWRASERLLDLTGDNVLPHEQDISRTVTKHFPDFQQDFAPIAIRLKNLGLPGVDTAQSIQDSISEILKGDASDATHRLGGETCSLYEDLLWVRKVKKAFDNGIETIIRKVNQYLGGMPSLPSNGIPGELIDQTATMRQGLQELINRNDFFDTIPELQTGLAGLDVKIEKAAGELIAEAQGWLEKEKKCLQKLKEWGQLGEADRIAIAGRMDTLKIETSADLKGIQKVINDQYGLMQELKLIQKEIESRAEAGNGGGGEGGEGQEMLAVDFPELPGFISSVDEIDLIIGELQSLKTKLGPYSKLRIKWKLAAEDEAEATGTEQA